MTMRVGSWPGSETQHNPFLGVFLDALRIAGCEVVSIAKTDDVGRQKLDVLVLHWPEFIFAEAVGKWDLVRRMRGFLQKLRALPERTRVVWIVHNLGPHDPRPLKRLLWRPYLRAVMRRVDAAMTLSPATVEQAAGVFPGLRGKPLGHFWHPLYPGAVLSDTERRRLRETRGWGDGVTVLGYCGQIRRYKGVETLINAFRGTTGSNLRLLIAGRSDDRNLALELRDAAKGDPRIVLTLEDLSREAFRGALGTCDLVVAPLREYLHSGSIVHALSAHRPVLTPATPFASGLRERVGADWMITYEGALTPELLDAAAQRRPADAAPDLSDFAPDRVGAQIASFFQSLTDDATL